jgi:hypothetical protein
MTDFADEYIDVQLELDGTWTSLTDDTLADGYSRVRADHGVVISRGKGFLEQRTPPTQCSVRINNSDGKYSRVNPRSPLWGQLGINTRMRVIAKPYETHIEYLDRYLQDKALFALDSATLDFTGDMEIRLDMHLRYPLKRGHVLVAKYLTSGDNRSYLLSTTNVGNVQFYWSPDGTFANRRVVTSSEPIPAGRFTLRVQFDADNGAGGISVTFYTGPTIDGPFTQLGNVVSSAGTSSIYSGTADVEIGSANGGFTGLTGLYLIQGKVYGIRLYDDIAGTLAAEGDFTGLEFDATSVSDGTTTWNVTGTSYIGSDKIRCAVEIPSWPIVQDSTGTDITSTLTGYGLLKSLNEGAQTLASPMTEYYQSVSNLGYWPCEDKTEATSIAAAVANTRSANASNISFASVTELPGSDAVMSVVEGSTASGVFPFQANPSGDYAFTFTYYADQSPSVPVDMIRLTTNNYNVEFTLGTVGYDITFTTPNGTTLDTDGSLYGTGAEPGNVVVFVLEMEQSGGTVDWVVNWRILDTSVGYALTGSFSANAAIMRGWSIPGLPDSSGLNTLSISHIAGINNIDTYLESAHLASFNGYNGESVTSRLTRLCSKNEIDLRIIGVTTSADKCGPQPIDTLIGIFDDTVNVGRGILTEQRDRHGLLYMTRSYLENQTPVSFAYDASVAVQIKLKDNPTIINDVIARRVEGSYYRAITTTGNRSVEAVGRAYQFDNEFNVQRDPALQNIAEWIRHIGSWDDIYYETVDLNLARNAIQDDGILLNSIIAQDIGNTMEITNLPDYLPIRPASLFIERYLETLNRFEWHYTIESSAARAYETAQFNFSPAILIGSNSSTLTSTINDSVTSIGVTIREPYKWEYSSDFYISVDNDREKMLVTGITGTSPSFTFTVTRGNPAFSHNSGVIIRLWDDHVLGY